MAACRSIGLLLELLEDVVLSESAASIGAHKSLDHIPGATILGTTAGLMYEGFSSKDASFEVFHAGRVRFGNGLPLSNRGLIGYPIPLSLYHRKGASAEDDGKIIPNGVRNFARQPIDPAADKEVQYKQIRAGYLSADLQWLRPVKVSSMKTAINPWTGRAAEQQLFGYEALAAGQRFVAKIEASLDYAWHIDEIADCLDGQEITLGRSRSAEYGRTHVKVIDLGDVTPAESSREGDHCVIWALSDLALQDQWGQPTLIPDPDSFGLGGGSIDWNRTFIRTRRYSPFNGHWSYRDLERAVILQGSVITFKRSRNDHLPSRRTVGLYQECGLGQIAVDPELLSEGCPKTTEVQHLPIPVPEEQISEVTRPPFVRWMEQRSRAQTIRLEDEDEIRTELEGLRRIYAEAARRAVGAPGALIGPGPSQWQAVRNALQLEADTAHRRLFDEKHGIARSNDPDWGVHFAEKPEGTFHHWLAQRFHQFSSQPERLRNILDQVARQAADMTREMARR